MNEPLNNTDKFPLYRVEHITGGLFISQCWQIYKRNPAGDTAETISYLNLTPHIMYKTEEAAKKKIEELLHG